MIRHRSKYSNMTSLCPLFPRSLPSSSSRCLASRTHPILGFQLKIDTLKMVLNMLGEQWTTFPHEKSQPGCIWAPHLPDCWLLIHIGIHRALVSVKPSFYLDGLPLQHFQVSFRLLLPVMSALPAHWTQTLYFLTGLHFCLCLEHCTSRSIASFTNFCNLLMKSSAVGSETGCEIREAGSSGVWSIGMSGLVSTAGIWPNLWLWIGADLLTVEGTAATLGFKKESIDPFFFFLVSLSCLPRASLQAFVPRWRFSRFASPMVPQFMRVLQSGQMAYPSASRIGCGFRIQISSELCVVTAFDWPSCCYLRPYLWLDCVLFGYGWAGYSVYWKLPIDAIWK